MSTQHTPEQWYVVDFPGQRRWFGQDELTARTYLLLMRAAFNLKPGFNLFLGRDVPPPHIAKPTGCTT